MRSRRPKRGSWLTGGFDTASTEGPPLAVDQALVWHVARLVLHRLALGDVEAKVKVIQRPAVAQLELLEDGIGADALVRNLRVVAAIHGRKGRFAAIDDRHSDQLVTSVVGELETLTAGGYQETPVARPIDRRLSIVELTPRLVCIVDFDAPRI